MLGTQNGGRTMPSGPRFLSKQSKRSMVLGRRAATATDLGAGTAAALGPATAGAELFRTAAAAVAEMFRTAATRRHAGALVYGTAVLRAAALRAARGGRQAGALVFGAATLRTAALRATRGSRQAGALAVVFGTALGAAAQFAVLLIKRLGLEGDAGMMLGMEAHFLELGTAGVRGLGILAVQHRVDHDAA